MPERLDFLVDGKVIRAAPARPMSHADDDCGFDFPDGSTGDDSDAEPELIIDNRRGHK